MNWLSFLRPKRCDVGRDGVPLEEQTRQDRKSESPTKPGTTSPAPEGEAKDPEVGFEPHLVDDDSRTEIGSLDEVTPMQPAEGEADQPLPEASPQHASEVPDRPAVEARSMPHSWLAHEKLVAAILAGLSLVAGAAVVLLSLIQDTQRGAAGTSVPALSSRSMPSVEGAAPGIAPGEYPEIPSETPETGSMSALVRLDGQGEGGAKLAEKTTSETDGDTPTTGVTTGAVAGASAGAAAVVGGAAEADDSRGTQGVNGAGSTAVVTGRPASVSNLSAGRSPNSASSTPRLAVVIDDWGYDWPAARQILGLKVPLTAAILPFAPLTREQAEAARQAGFEVILHMPMEPFDSSISLSAETVRTNMTEDTIKELVGRALRAVPQAVGVSNHQGSRATSDARVMRAVLEVVRQEGLFFLDSRTSNQSVAVTVARQLGVPAAANRIFIDNDDDVAAIEARLWEAVELARREGQAIAIGHVHRSTAVALARTLPKIQKAGIELVTVSSMTGSSGGQPVTRPVSTPVGTPTVSQVDPSVDTKSQSQMPAPSPSPRTDELSQSSDQRSSKAVEVVGQEGNEPAESPNQNQNPEQTEASSRNPGTTGMTPEKDGGISDSPTEVVLQVVESEAVDP